jgi:xanthine dehydrogenase accessory factor
MKDVILELAKAINDKRNVVMATVSYARGGTPVRAGARILVSNQGIISGTVGGGKLEAAVLSDCLRLLSEGGSKKTHYSLTEKGKDALGMICGGEVEVFMETFEPNPRLVIVGGGHIGNVLMKMGELIGYEICVVDVRDDRSDVADLKGVILDKNSYIVLITSDYQSDEAALRFVLNYPVGYIGMIASRTKSRIILKKLRDDGISEEKIASIYSPIGLDLGGRTPQEIALAILSEIVTVRYGRSGVPISRSSEIKNTN